jgi:hypothetical protein
MLEAIGWRTGGSLDLAGGRYDVAVGFVRRVRWWRSDAVAERPGLPLPVQAFVMIVVLTMWDRQAAASASASV